MQGLCKCTRTDFPRYCTYFRTDAGTQLEVVLICQPSYINPTSLNLKKLDSEVVLVLGLIIHVCGEANDIDKVDEVGGEGEPVP